MFLQEAPILIILPKNIDESPYQELSPIKYVLEKKQGVTIKFDDDDRIIKFYKEFVSKHEIIMTDIQEYHTIKRGKIYYGPLLWNNVDEVCGLSYDNLYILHPPDDRLRKKALQKLVNYFFPEIEEGKEEKPEWVYQYELTQLGLQEIESKIKEIDDKIEKLSEQKNQKIYDKEKKAKWSDLITKQGKTLELRLKEAFELLGVEKIDHEPNGSHGPDLFIQHKGKEFIIEIEGSKGPIRIDKARELLHWIADANPDQKGILIGNPFLELHPSKRPPSNKRLFVKEAVGLSKSRNFTLINSQYIFNLVCRKIKGETVDIDNIVSELYNSNGELRIS